MNGLERSYPACRDLCHGTKVLSMNGPGEGKTFHTAGPTFLKCLPETAAASVFSGRENFKPTRCWSSRWPTQTALACMIREEVFNPLAGPMGALGISNETKADLGKERRTTTKAPPAEMLRAVANSRQSLPLPSWVRTKTGMASWRRAHLRSSFFDNLRATCYVRQSEGVSTSETASYGPNLGQAQRSSQSSQTTLLAGRLPKWRSGSVSRND